MEHWRSFLDQDASHDTVADAEHGNMVVSIDRADRARRPMPVFFRACRGRSCLVHDREPMHAPYEFGMAQCHVHLLHVKLEINPEVNVRLR
eukprot:2740661-Pyramimonas_sp.AAC.1